MMTGGLVTSVLFWAILAGTSGPAGADTPLGRLFEETFSTVQGDRFRFPGPDQCKAVVIIFIGHDCPISNAYAPEIIRLCKEYLPKKVVFCLVYADPDLPLDEARKHAREYGFICPVIYDPQLRLARGLGAKVQPEAAVVSPAGELLYLGRIDDLYFDFSRKRPEATRHDLRNALEAVLAGKPVPVARTRAIGCYIPYPDKR
jgi:hypothetical protein